MKFSKLAEYLYKLESTTKRLEMIDILTDLIRHLPKDSTREILYLTCGYLKAPFESVKFNIADKMMVKILSAAFSTSKNIYKDTEIQKMYGEKGDLGDVAYELAPRSSSNDPNVLALYDKLMEIALLEGTGSQDAKVKKTAQLLFGLDKLSAKYMVRIILGTTRLGFTETTVIEALANFLGDRKLKEKIESAYNIYPDIGLVAQKIITRGLPGLKDITIEPGVPVLSQKAQRVEGFINEVMERMHTTWAEFKFDGTRVQLHMDRNKAKKGRGTGQNQLFGLAEPEFLLKTYTRNLEETTHQYPDITDAAIKQINARSAILDGEAIGFNKKTGAFLPFQETMQRKRKYDISQMAKDIPLKYFVFDILYLNGKSLIDKSLEERRKILKDVIKKGETIILDEHLETASTKEVEEYFEEAKRRGLEGLIAKNPKDAYQAGARSYSWIKLKAADEKLLQDSIDCVVLGYYFGKGLRSQFGVGGFLVGIYDNKSDSYKTLSKIGTGLKEEDWAKLKKLADKVKISDIPTNVEVNKVYKPDIVTKPSIVVEIGADEISVSKTHTAGYALRFPRLIKFRTDKSAKDATTLDEVKKLFKTQRDLKK